MSSSAATVNAEPTAADFQDGPAVHWLEQILQQAVQWDASDIHIEPREGSARVRLRIDGVLHEVETLGSELRERVASRIKVLSRLDIAERRLPQDGRLKAQVGARTLDCRVSTLPTLFGEKVVMRLQPSAVTQTALSSLGYDSHQLSLLLDSVHAPQGLMLVTGPTGSGKTVSLYACLHAMNQAQLNISTVEDPVEMELAGVNQVQVNEKAGLDFATALRAFLRQDPDVLMVGEIRDLETADMAVKAAQTGHLVLSTLHTNDAPSTLSRLVSMGVVPHLLASSLRLVTAQRLIRRLCERCKAPTQHPPALLLKAGMDEDSVVQQGATWRAFAAVGCAACRQGFKGRVGVFEVMPVSDALQALILMAAPTRDLAAQARQEGVTTLRQAALAKFKAGWCSLEEVLSGTSVGCA